MRRWPSFSSDKMAATPTLAGVLLLLMCCFPMTLPERVLDMDRLSSCASGANNEPIIVYDDPVILNAHSRSPPPNPPTTCTVMFKSGFTEADGYHLLEIVIEKVDIRDSQVFVTIFNGLGVYGAYLRNLGKNSQSTDVLYTTGSEATVRLTRPAVLYQTAYDVTLKITAYKDRNDPGTVVGVAKLSAGGIIGIVVGLLIMLVIVVVVIWCLTTGKIYDYLGRPHKSGSQEKIGPDGSNLSRAASQDMSGFDHKDPVIWNTLTTGQYTPGSTPNQTRRSFRQGQNRGLPPFAGGTKPTVTVGEEDVRLTVGRQGAQWRRDSEGRTQPGDYSDVYEPGGRFRSTSNADYINSRWGSAKENGGEGDGENQQGSPGRFRRGAPPRGSRQSGGDPARSSLTDKEKARLAMEGSTGTAQDNFQRSGSGRGSGRGSMRRDDPARSSKRSAEGDETEMKRRSKAGGDDYDDDDEGIPGKKKRRPGSGLFENPDEEGYMYDYDQLHALSGSDVSGKPGEGKDASAMTNQAAPPSLDNTATTISAPEATVTLNAQAGRGHQGNDLDTSTDNQTGNDAASEDTPKKGGKPQKKRRSDKKKSSKKKKGRSILDTSSIDYSDPDAMPPEAFDPIFSKDSNPSYGQGRQPPGGFGYSPYQAPYGMPMMMPYGMVPMQPGMQTYAYAYQGAAPDGQQPGTTAGQAAWVVQETPTRDGPMQKTAFMMATTTSPSNPASRQGSFRGHPGSPNHASTPAGQYNTPHRGSGRGKQNPADRNALALPHGRPGATPGHKTAMMKAGTDPDTGVHTTQTMWSDSVPDPSDPPPGANPQITRKTVTRITTRSGHTELPSAEETVNFTDMFAIEPDQPDFLSPSRSVQGGYSARALPSTFTPERDNVAFYDGPVYPGHPGAPGQVVHNASRHKAIRDRVSSRDSFA